MYWCCSRRLEQSGRHSLTGGETYISLGMLKYRVWRTIKRVYHVPSRGEHSLAKTRPGHDTHKWEKSNPACGHRSHCHSNEWDNMGNNGFPPPLQKSNTKFHTYTGDKLNILGTREGNIDYQGQHYYNPIKVEGQSEKFNLPEEKGTNLDFEMCNGVMCFWDGVQIKIMLIKKEFDESELLLEKKEMQMYCYCLT